MTLPDLGSHNEKFERLDYGYLYSTMLLGCVFLVFCWMILQYLVYLVLKVLATRYHKAQRLVKKLHDTLFWKQWIVMGYANFTELIICVFLQTQIVNINWMENRWVFLSFLFWIVIILTIMYLFFATIHVVIHKIGHTESSTNEMQTKYGILIEIMDENNKWAFFLHISYFVRRTVLAVVCIYWNSKPIFQLFIIINTNLLGAVMQVALKPAATPEQNKHLFFDEVTMILILDCLMCCTDMVTRGDSRYAVGFWIIALTIQSILIHVIVLLLRPIRKLKLFVKYVIMVRRNHSDQT